MNNMDWSGALPYIWLGACVLFIIVEAITTGLTTIWFAAGALIAMILAFAGAGIWVQVLVFLIGSLVLLAATRKIMTEKLHMGAEKTNADALIGAEAVVVEKIEQFGAGRVKVRGMEWAARAQDENLSFEKGEKVSVTAIEGVKLIVK